MKAGPNPSPPSPAFGDRRFNGLSVDSTVYRLKLDFIDAVPHVEGLVVVPVREFEEDVERAATIRDRKLIPVLTEGRLVVLDFKGIRAATQSFAHALMYRVLRDTPNVEVGLSISGADSATQQAIRTVAAYARVKPTSD